MIPNSSRRSYAKKSIELTSNLEVRWTVGIIDSIEIDRINILRASHRAMRMAIKPTGTSRPRLDRWAARDPFSVAADGNH